MSETKAWFSNGVPSHRWQPVLGAEVGDGSEVGPRVNDLPTETIEPAQVRPRQDHRIRYTTHTQIHFILSPPDMQLLVPYPSADRKKRI